MLQIGTVDGLVNITEKNIRCFVNAISSFDSSCIQYAKKNNISFGAAFQRFVEPVYNNKKTVFDINDISIPVYTKNGSEQSPARMTYCKKMGLLRVDEKKEIFELTPLALELRNNKITIEEFAFILLTKQGIFKDNIYQANLFVFIAKLFENNATITERSLLDEIKTAFSDTNIVKTRADIIVNALAMCGIITSVNRGAFALSNIESADIFKDFRANDGIISDSLLDGDDNYTDFMGSLDHGVFDILSKKNLRIYCKKFRNLVKYIKDFQVKNDCLQIIFYGAPGTGKSYKANEIVKKYTDTIRTTFHPDSDYASFVGCYKPIEKEETRTFVHWDPVNQEPVLLKLSNKTGIPELDKEKKITYQFTQQAFLKAYIQAWEKMCKNNHSEAASSITTVVPPVGSVSLSFPVKSITYTIIEVTTKSIRVKREFDLIKNSVKNVWESLWTSGDFIIPRGSQSGRSVQIAVCRWIYENLDDSTKDSFDDGWTLLIDTLNSGEVYVSVADSKSSQVYTVTKIEDNDASVHISNVASSKRARLKKCFEGTKPDGVEIGLIDVLKRIDPESFDGAWETLTGKITKGENEYSDIQDDELLENKEEDGLMTDPQYLVIEEINRGNCAQIFGDIFQLLDRNDAGFSTYPIVPDADITRELKTVFASLDLSSVESYINGIFLENYPNGIVDKIKSGELLVLPPNLNLLATMNTSDQSLFPMDSAFKRRWDWEYVPIRYTAAEAKDDKDNFHKFTITIDDKHHYLWTDFLQKVNAKILSVTDSEDKQMGEYFIKKNINQDEFINKVMYYLWNEVGKDMFGSTKPFFELPEKTEDGKDAEKKQFSFNELFKGDATKLLQGFMKKLEVKSKEEKAATPTPATPAEV